MWGDIDGFVSLEEQPKIIENLKILMIFRGWTIALKKAGQRFNKQFQLVEAYEAQYVYWSSKLTPDSKTLSYLKERIDNLRSTLKRPNEILVSYK